MKKLFFTVCYCFAITFSMAQVHMDEGASMGVRAGMNFSLLNFGNASESFSPGASIGIFSKATLQGQFSFQPELSASMQNTNVEFDESLGGAKFSLSFYYAEVAFLGVYNINYHVSVHAGAFLSYLFRFTSKNENVNVEAENYISRKNFYDINFGLITGGAYEFKRFDIGLRMNFGMFTIGKNDTLEGYSPYTQTKNSYFQVYGAYIF
ncbi:MAG: porin family protein [Bacteroidia bacterium]